VKARPFGRALIRYSLLLMLHPAAALADTPQDLIQRGNDHYQAGRYAEALEAYEQADQEYGNAVTAELLHNQAAAQFKLGQIDAARELWVRAATLEDALFEAAVRYNLGNCAYADALRAVENQDVSGALELLDRAGAQYRDAVRLDPDLTNARANLELAQMLKEQIKQQTTTQPQSQPSSQPQQQEQRQDQSSSQPSSQPSEQGDQSDQQDRSSSTQPTSQPDQQPQTQPSQEPESQPEQEQPDQPSPTSQPRGLPQTQPADAQPQDQPAVELRMTRAEAERLLQMIRDAEQARRRVLRQREAARHRPVERDW
jgi:Ca-activated chloride channel family protein